MKRILFLFMLVVSVLQVGAKGHDFGTYAVGLKGNYGFDSDYNNVGFGLSIQGFLTDHFRYDINGNYFFKKDNARMIDVNVNFDYVIPIAQKAAVYPLVGVGYFYGKFYGVGGELPPGVDPSLFDDDYDNDSESKIGLNLGAGIEYYVIPELKVFGEYKYQIVSKFDRSVASVGVAYVW